MTAINFRSSALAIKEEVTEGTPVVPTAATDYLALQDDFSMTPGFDVLENNELKASIGIAKPILGAETPTASGSFYLRHSGVEGQAPNHRLLLKAAFGAEDVEGTEYNTVAGSTTSVVNVDAGEGATFIRGQGLLIKDATNGYSIRPVHSIATDALTLGFSVGTAPGTGVNLGKSVTYYPANSGHPSLTLSEYLGNGGALQVVAGARVVDSTFTFEAGQLINANYSLEGLSFYFDPIVIAAADRYLDFTDDDGTWAAVVAAGTYKDPHDLAEALQAAMRAASPGETATVTYNDSTGKYNIRTTGTVLSLLWNTGANTANTIGDKIGFSVAADDTGTAATTGYTSDNAITLSSPQTPTFDSSDPLAAKDNEVFLGDSTDNVCFCASSVVVNMATPRTTNPCVCEESGVSGSIINQRTVTVSISALLDKWDADKFHRFHTGADTRFMYNFGVKTGGNWIAGKCGGVYLPNTTITSWELSGADGLVQLDMEVQAYVDSSGNGEVYLYNV